MNEIFELKKKYENNFEIFTYKEIDEVSFGKKVKENIEDFGILENNFCNFSQKNLIIKEDKGIDEDKFKIILKEKKLALDLNANFNEKLIELNLKDVIFFRKYFETEKIFSKELEFGGVNKNENMISYMNSNLKDDLIHKDKYTIWPFLLTYVNGRYQISEKIKVHYDRENYEKFPGIEKLGKKFTKEDNELNKENDNKFSRELISEYLIKGKYFFL